MSWKLTTPYIAGFFDGEGCVQIRKRGKRWEGALRFVGTSWPILKSVAEKTGGSLITRKGTHSTYYEVIIRDKNLGVWAKKLRPYLHIKRDEVDLLIAFRKSIEDNGRRHLTREVEQYRHDIVATCKALKKRRFPA